MSEKYSADFSLWINQTAQLLREHRWHEIDMPNLIERANAAIAVAVALFSPSGSFGMSIAIQRTGSTQSKTVCKLQNPLNGADVVENVLFVASALAYHPTQKVLAVDSRPGLPSRIAP